MRYSAFSSACGDNLRAGLGLWDCGMDCGDGKFPKAVNGERNAICPEEEMIILL
jgi:hypothetical protein